MSGTRIEDFRFDVREYIEKYHSDSNGNGSIDKDNGELANLISNTGVDNEDELYSTGRLRNKYIWGMTGTLITGLFGLKTGYYLTKGEPYKKAQVQYDKQLVEMRKIITDFNECKINKPAEEVAETLRKLYKKPFLLRAHNKLAFATQLIGEAALVATAIMGIKAAYTSESHRELACV